MRRAVAGAALALVAFAGCSTLHVPGSDLTGWHAAKLGSVGVLAQAGPDETRAFARDLAVFDAAFERLLGRRIEPAVPTTIVLIREPDLGMRFMLGRGVEGWAATELDREIAFVRMRPNRVATQMTLLHEYTHLILRRHRTTPLPRWYNEGLAVYLSTLSMRDGALVVGAVPTDRLAGLASGPAPLTRLFGPEAIRGGREVGAFYATSWALVHLLLGTPKGRTELARFEEALARGVPSDEAFDAAFGRSVDALEAELDTHVGYLRRGVPAEIVLETDRLEMAEPAKAEALDRGAVAKQLGLLCLAAGRDDEWLDRRLARALLEIAADAAPRDPVTQAALAEARAAGGDRNRAEAAMAVAVAEAGDDSATLVRAGRTRLALDDPAGGLEAFRRAADLDALSPMAWEGLGRALAALERPEEALAALERARSLGWSPYLDLELGRLYLAAGRHAEARERLLPLARDPHGGRAARRAETLLREAGLLPELAPK